MMIRFNMLAALVCVIGVMTTSHANAQTLSINDYSYDTVCDFTNRYFVKLKRRIDPKEWDAILKGKGKVTKPRDKNAVTMITYAHRGLLVRYSLDSKKRPRIWQVDLDESRISESLRTRKDFIAMFEITPNEITEPAVSLECDGAIIKATIDNKRVRKLSLVMSPSAL